MMKKMIIYYAKSNQVTDTQSQKELEFLKKIFKDHSIIYHKGGPYNPEHLEASDILIVTSTDYKLKIGRGIANQVLNAVNTGKRIYILNKDAENNLYLRTYDSYKLADHNEWKDGYAKIQAGEAIEIKNILKNGGKNK